MTPIEIQKIVDGEVTHEKLAVALKKLDLTPSDWRALALAFLEEQQWSKQISKMKGVNALKLAKSQEVVIDRVAADSATETNKRSATWWGSLGPGAVGSAFMGALAASLILSLGFTAGMLSFDWQVPNGPDPDSIAKASSQSQDAKNTTSARRSTHPKNLDQGMRMVVTGPNDETAEIPIYDLGEIDPREMWAKEDLEIARLNNELRRKGYQLEVRPEYYTSKLNDGRQLIVPVKNVNLKPYGL